MAERIIKEELTAERLRELLNYNPDTGEFVWRVSCQGTNAGDLAGSSGSEGRRHITIGYARFKAHRLAWLYVYGSWPRKLIDHINGNPTDNRIANLREASMSENLCNQSRAHINNKTGLLGAQIKSGRKNYRARIVVGGKEVHLGHFKTADLAHQAYLAAKARFHSSREITKEAHPSPNKSRRCDSSMSGVTGVKRVYRVRTGERWLARIKIDGVEKYLGTFPTKELAHSAYLAAKG